VDATHGIAGEGDSRSSSDNGGGWRPMNFLQTVAERVTAGAGINAAADLLTNR